MAEVGVRKSNFDKDALSYQLVGPKQTSTMRTALEGRSKR